MRGFIKTRGLTLAWLATAWACGTRHSYMPTVEVLQTGRQSHDVRVHSIAREQTIEKRAVSLDQAFGLSYHYRYPISSETTVGTGLSLGVTSLEGSWQKRFDRFTLLLSPQILLPTSDPDLILNLAWIGATCAVFLPISSKLDFFIAPFQFYKVSALKSATLASLHLGFVFGSNKTWALLYAIERQQLTQTQNETFEQLSLAYRFAMPLLK